MVLVVGQFGIPDQLVINLYQDKWITKCPSRMIYVVRAVGLVGITAAFISLLRYRREIYRNIGVCDTKPIWYDYLIG